MSVTQRDTASLPIPPIPPGTGALAGYLNGSFRTYHALLEVAGDRPVLPISVWVPRPGELAGLRQIAFDFERGDLRPDQARECIDVAHADGIPCPVAYGSLDTWLSAGGLTEQLAGLRRGGDYQGWLAHPDGIAQLPRGFAAKQYLFGAEFDISIVADPATFYNLAPTPKPPSPEETMAITATTNKDGRIEVFVEANDGSIWHTYQQEPDGGWSGAEQGVRNAELTKLAAAPSTKG